MTLREILNILGKNKAAEIAGCGKSAAWHWYQKGKKQKVPEMQALIQWSDHLKLSDAELGELVRDAHRRRVSILEGLAQEDKIHIRTRSVLRRDLAREIAQELTSDEVVKRDTDLRAKKEAASKKEIFLDEQAKERARLRRLEEYKEKLNKLRRENGNN